MHQTDNFNEIYAQRYIAQLPRGNQAHAPTILTFSAMPGSGKTTLARRLAHDLGGIWVRHDTIRDMIRQDGLAPAAFDVKQISRRIIDDVMARGHNRFIILDGSIDRSWPIFFAHAAQLHARPVVIRIAVPFAVAKARLEQRDGPRDPHWTNLVVFKAQFEHCQAEVPADLTLGETYDYEAIKEFMANCLAPNPQ